jgi:hypothetical protein
MQPAGAGALLPWIAWHERLGPALSTGSHEPRAAGPNARRLPCRALH